MPDRPHFTRDTAVERVGPGRYRATLRDEWNTAVIPQGGVVAAVGLRAMEAELGVATQRLRSATTVFAAQVRSGPVEIDVTLLRRGRSMSQVSATVRSAERDRGGHRDGGLWRPPAGLRIRRRRPAGRAAAGGLSVARSPAAGFRA